MSTMVRAIAMAVIGSLEGSFINALERVSALRTTVIKLTDGPEPAMTTLRSNLCRSREGVCGLAAAINSNAACI